MPLTEKQKRYIRKNRTKKSVPFMAKHLGVSHEEVLAFLDEKNWTAVKGSEAKEVESKKRSQITNWRSLFTFVKDHRYFFLFLVGVTIAVYANAVDNAFVSDDIYGIVKNPEIGNIGLALKQLNGHRLLKDIIYLLFGKSLFAYHAANILFHALNAVLVYFFVLLVTNSIRVSAFSSLIFALHPVQTESVTWISGGRYPMYAFFFLLSFIFFHFYLENRNNNKYLTLSVFGFLLALFSNLWALSLTAVYFIYAQFVRKEKMVWEFYVFVAGICLAYLLFIRSEAASRVSDISSVSNILGNTDNPLVTIPFSITKYLFLLFWPIPLTLYHEGQIIYPSFLWASRAISLLVLIGLPLFFRKNRKLLFFLAFFFLVILFSLSPVQLGWYVAERYVYLSVVSFAVFVSYLFYLLEDILGVKDLALILLIPLLLFYSVRTVIRNNDWQSRESLWFATARVSPRSPKVHNNLGDIYSGKGDFENALREFQKARELRPMYAEATHNLGNTYFIIGNYEQAKKYFREAVEYDPYLYQSYYTLGVIAHKEGNLELSRQYFEKVLEIVPSHPDALGALQHIEAGQ